MQIDRHVFGSRTGYTTLAYSGDLSESDCRKLEVFGFGQTSDRGYLDSLASMPAYISRPLDQSRRAITRVFPGQPDDAGRNTLLLVSVILSNSDWIRTLRGDVLPLLNNADLWKWDGQPRLASINTSIPGPHPLSLDSDEASEIVGLISEIERVYSSRRNVVISEPKYSLTTVRTVEMLIPDSAKPAFSCSARSLSANLSVNLNCVARGVGISSVGPSSQVYKPRTDGILSPYATELVRGKIIQGMIPDSVMRSYRGFGTVAEQVIVAQSLGLDPEAVAAGGRARKLKPKREPMSSVKKAVIGLTAFALIATSIVVWVWHTKARAEYQRKNNADIAATLLNMTPQEFVQRSAAKRQKDLEDADSLAEEIKNGKDYKQDIKKSAEGLPGWQRQIKPLHDQLVEFEKQIAKTRTDLLEDFPTPDDAQLSESEKNKKKTAIKTAQTLPSEAIGGGIVLLQTCLRDDLQSLKKDADRVGNEIHKRELSYQEFMSAARTKLGKGSGLTQDDVVNIEKDIQSWLTLAKLDSGKCEELNRLTEQCDAIRTKLNNLERARRDLGALKNALASKDSSVRRKALVSYEGVMSNAKPLESELEGLVLEVELAHESINRSVQAEDIGRKISIEMQTFLSTTDKPEKNKLDKTITNNIVKLEKLDPPYAKALGDVFNALKTSPEQKS